jgi:hypothetical protein
MTELVATAGALAVPDPRAGVVPVGWWEYAAEAIDATDSWDELDDLEGKLAAVVAYLESLGGDQVEFLKALRVVEKRRGDLLGPKEKGGRGKTLTRVLEIDASAMTLSRWRLLSEHWALLLPWLRDATRREQVSQSQLLRLVREHTPARADPDVADVAGERLTILHGDFRERLLELEAGSVDLIVTDPPYPKEDLPLYSDLGQVAALLLGPRGILFCWTGQIFLPEVIGRLSEQLTYGWTFALRLPGQGSRILGRHIVQAWKPVLAFTTGTWPSGKWGDDLLISPAPDKDTYEWQQSALPARRLIERYCPPDGLVVDPFLGVGSFGVAAREAGCRFVGVELDAGRHAKAVQRIAG